MRLRREFNIPASRSGRLQVLSSGGGTQSNCMIVLAYNGLIPKPDIIVMANTEREASNVFEYQKNHIAPLCEEMGVDYEIIQKSEYTKDDVVYKNGETTLPPFFSTYNGRSKDGKAGGKQPGFCSDKWKKVPIHRFLNDRYGKKELDKCGVDMWIGMSFDEARRVKYPSGKWQKRYPLFESQITRQQAIQIVKDFGLPEPPRSACWMCPNRRDDEWQWMKENVPQDMQAAIAFEKELQKDFPWFWLHPEGRPIGEIDFKKLSRSSKQIDKFDRFCDTGMCFI